MIKKIFSTGIHPIPVIVLIILCCFQQLSCSSELEPQFLEPPSIVPNPQENVPLAAILKLQVNKPVEVVLRVSDSLDTRNINYGYKTEKKLELPVIGLRPGTAYRFEVQIKDKANNSLTLDEELSFSTPSLPRNASMFPRISVNNSLPNKVEPGFTLLNPRRRLPRESQIGNEEERQFGERFGMLLAVDSEGIPIWYYNAQTRISDFDYLSNGNIQYVTTDFRIIEIDILGNTINSWFAKNRPTQQPSTDGIPVDALTFHHDADRMESGNITALSTEQRIIDNYYTSAYDERSPRQTQNVMGDVIITFNPQGNIVWKWNAFDHLDPFRIGYETFIPYWIRRGFPNTIDWSHANALVYKSSDESILVNFRLQSSIVKIDRDTGEIEWIFGEHSGWPAHLKDKLIAMDGDSRWFWHQHAPVWTKRNTLLLFDNGNYRARPFTEPVPVDETWSRAVEYSIDEENREAHEIWSSEIPGDPKVVSIAMGSVQELPTMDNILVGYGALLDTANIDNIDWQSRAKINQWTRVREYSRTRPPKIVWEMQLLPTGKNGAIGWTIFGAKRINEFILN
ncbi:MAG: aryl-sulfate sulfotransferase [Balneolaceae bacterium]|nr:aryl-sulfate sulfotransferase [Balneolaceae bacterium]